MELEKATLQQYNPKTGKTEGKQIKVLFNPTQYKLTKSNQFAEVAIPGLSSPLLQFARGNISTLTMQLFFDTYEQGTDVRDHTRQITGLLEINTGLHAPPICLFTWGKLNFRCVVERADQQFTLFLPNGVPVRATVDVTLKEYFDPKKQIGGQQSADFTKRYIVQRGDTLSSIAAQQYGDPAMWRPIATENNIDDPLSLHPGQVLVVPAIA